MDTVKTCPKCHKENSPESAVCAFCGAAMLGLIPSLTTEPVPDVPLKIKPPEHIIELTRLYSDIIALVVLGQEQPILLKGGEKTILGRYSPGEVTPSVDLTPYNANLLGVSRKHATISRTETGYLLEDLDSTNGTWLNENKLPATTPTPVQSGDLIRLGQLGLYVYFDMGRNAKNPEVELTLRKENLESRTFTIKDLSAQLTPYLTALDGLQKVCDSIGSRTNTEINLMSIRFDPEIATIKLTLDGGQDAYHLLITKFSIWKTNNLNQIKLMREMKTAQVQIAENGQNNLNDEYRQEIEKSELDLAQDIIKNLAADQPESRQQEFAAQLVPHIHAWALISLNLTITG
jgi:pSer/pThr/pTyr-binding forkhead associated (FHA) protein